MSDPVHSMEIDRIRLIGLEVPPERAERVRAMVEMELQRLLERGRWSEGLAGGEVSHLDAPTMHVDSLHSDNRLANGIARSVAQTLHDVG
jgi:hypothetical protein